MDNQVIFGGQNNMQNNMQIVHVGIFHLFQKTKTKKNMLGIKTLILQHLTTWAFHTWHRQYRNKKRMTFLVPGWSRADYL